MRSPKLTMSQSIMRIALIIMARIRAWTVESIQEADAGPRLDIEEDSDSERNEA
jgi:hypothetical protein